MSPAEKLKRIKLISEKLYSDLVVETLKIKPITNQICLKTAEASIGAAKIFVENFVEFEDKFMKENEVRDND